MNEIRKKIQEIKEKIQEIEGIINVQLQRSLPPCYLANEIRYVNLSDGTTEEKMKRIVEQIVNYKINIINNPKDSALIRCAIVSEIGMNGLKMWLLIRSMSDNYNEDEQVRKYKYLLSRRERININFGVIVNRYKLAIDTYNQLLYKK